MDKMSGIQKLPCTGVSLTRQSLPLLLEDGVVRLDVVLRLVLDLRSEQSEILSPGYPNKYLRIGHHDVEKSRTDEPSISLQPPNKLLEVTSAPILESFRDQSVLLLLLVIVQGFSYMAEDRAE